MVLRCVRDQCKGANGLSLIEIINRYDVLAIVSCTLARGSQIGSLCLFGG